MNSRVIAPAQGFFKNLTLVNLPSYIDSNWLARPATEVAPDLIGCYLVRQLPGGEQLCGLIVETEAYTPDDPACHAYRRRTPRNSVMFGLPGRAYVYLIYGMYHCLNIVTDVEGLPSAVLIRALQLDRYPEGLDRSCHPKLDRIAAGPGKLCRVLQIDVNLNGQVLVPNSLLWLTHRKIDFQHQLDRGHLQFVQTTRIGLTQGADLPWRWYLQGCPSISKL